MRTASLFIVTLAAASAAYADFSYTTNQKSAGGLAAAAAPRSTKYYFKGQKMKIEAGDTATIMDFDAQTITTIQLNQKTYSVTPFSELSQAVKQANVEAQLDVKETGQKKKINGYDASELLMTMALDNAQARQAGMKMQMEVEMWLSSEVPGAQELRSFYQKNAAKFPWAALGAGGNPSMQNAIAEMQKKVASMGGVPVLQVVRAKAAGGEAQNPQLAQARAQLEELAKQGGPAAAMAQQQLARMGAAGSGSGALFEMTTESSDFSTSSVPDSVFAIPAAFQKVDKK